ncbi:hypothetical protein [Halobaculum litoreum]|uniref:Uncharacterized protein n=1 Tax=Halobaculum litoreum TaxID=3031998 RepID=A0ABD5XRA4_9EURY|nr:hypothetical protein [Halobaculum sp. DT92]
MYVLQSGAGLGSSVGTVLRAVAPVVDVVVAVAVAVVVFLVARWTVPRAVDRLGTRYDWTANGESVLTAAGIGAGATLGLLLATSAAGYAGYGAGWALVLGGVVTGVGVERRRVRTVSPVLEALGVLAALLAVGVVTVAVGGLVRVVGVFLAAGALGGLGTAAVGTVTTASPPPVDDAGGAAPGDGDAGGDPRR